jgi:hypothetical protein
MKKAKKREKVLLCVTLCTHEVFLENTERAKIEVVL